MRTTTLMSLQFISLITMIGSAESLLCKAMPTILFVLSFSVFAACSIYKQARKGTYPRQRKTMQKGLKCAYKRDGAANRNCCPVSLINRALVFPLTIEYAVLPQHFPYLACGRAQHCRS